MVWEGFVCSGTIPVPFLNIKTNSKGYKDLSS